MKKVY
jgi:Ca2+-binding EF-hand superfamily protein